MKSTYHQMLTKNAAAGNHLTFSMAKTLKSMLAKSSYQS